jgi:hypothetical protein
MSIMMFHHMDLLSSMGGGGPNDPSEHVVPVVKSRDLTLQKNVT